MIGVLVGLLLVSCCVYVTTTNIGRVKRFDWHDDGQVYWSTNCDFFGGDLRETKVPSEQCGPTCASTDGCNAFTWTSQDGGTCYMKSQGFSRDNAKYLENAVCGIRKSGGPANPLAQGNVDGTFWADRTDAGGCQMPEGDYVVQHALALGQSESLGWMKWRSGLCGQVLKIRCGGETVEAVVASTCNLGSASCGVDMIRPTWNRATGNKQPGIEKCSVEFTGTNPLNHNGPVCYFRPNSNSQAYYASLGILNASGRIVKSATAAGVEGRFQAGSGWFDFDGNGQPKFQGDAEVVFRFEDGTSHMFKLSDCKNGGNTHIWS